MEAVKGEAKALREVLQQQRPQTASSELNSETDQATCSLKEQLAAVERQCGEAEAKLARLPDLEQRCGEAEGKVQALATQLVSSDCNCGLCTFPQIQKIELQELTGSAREMHACSTRLWTRTSSLS